MTPRLAFDVERIDLAPGDVVLICTDGATEAMDEHGALFGETKLGDVVRRHRDLPLSELVEAVARAVDDFRANPPADDVTILALRREETKRRRQKTIPSSATRWAK